MSLVTPNRDLRAIRNRMLEIELQIRDNGGLLEPDTEAELTALAHAEAGECGYMIVKYKRRHDKLESLVKRAKVALAFMKSREDAYRAMLRHAFEASGEKKLKHDLFTASYMPGRGAVEIEDPSQVPDEYCEVEMVRKPSKDLIKAAWEAGIKVPGTHFSKEPFVMVRMNEDAVLSQDIEGEIA